METDADARVALLERLIDHAPLFPPASLDLPEALAEDRRAPESTVSFVLARFVCPSSRLTELPDIDRALSVVLDGPLDQRERRGRRGATREELESLSGLAPEIYVEVPLDECPGERLDADRSVRASRPRSVAVGRRSPSTTRSRGSSAPAVSADLAFKATAGLHHAVRTDGEHGFLNLLAAVMFGDEEDALAEEEPDAFGLDRERFGWRGRIARPLTRSSRPARRRGFRSIGSCSFFEPVEALEALGVLPL